MPKVLVVDDNAVNRLVLAVMLKRLSCSVMLAEDGPAALVLAEEEQFDLVLMDIAMPEMDGFEATWRLLANHKTKELSVIAVTAFSCVEMRAEAAAAGMADFLVKPVQYTDLAAALARHLPTVCGGLLSDPDRDGAAGPIAEFRTDATAAAARARSRQAEVPLRRAAEPGSP